MKGIFFFILFLPFIAFSQQLNLFTSLPDSIKESSGLIYLNDKIISHNDSGNEAVLFELDSLTGNITRHVVIGNATNFDWEYLCFDATYIADVGNNSGTGQEYLSLYL